VAVSIRTREGAVSGVEAIEWRTGKTHALPASSVVLATGGGGRIYERTDNPARMTGDGYALALDLGLSLRDMEFVQFYPLGLDEPDLPVWMVGLPIVDLVRLTDGKGREFMKEAFASWGQERMGGELPGRDGRPAGSVRLGLGDAATLHFEDLPGDVLRRKTFRSFS
jgi:succinate dehydrogenase/fumarate reductase flavoprotein subunit